jgi:hypothetical protein
MHDMSPSRGTPPGHDDTGDSGHNTFTIRPSHARDVNEVASSTTKGCWRWDGAGYRYGEQHLSEEELDIMTTEACQAFVALWVVSGN